MNRTLRAGLTAVVAGALVASCGGSDDDSTADTSPAATALTDSTAGPSTSDVPSGTSAPSDTTASADYDEGDIGFRVVNALDEPVDVYVRTTGLVEAFVVETGVAPGSVTDLAYPPADGVFLVTKAGAGDPTCVSGCDHFITELTATTEEGPVRTVVLYDDEFDGPRSFDLWEQPDPSREGNANAMPAADSTNGVVVVTAIAVRDADFGLRLAIEGAGVCQEPFNLENVLIGGNQTPAFTYADDSVELTVHANDDRDCTGDPVGGPFTVDGGAGTRTHLILLGEPGSLDSIVVPMIDDETSAGDSDDGSTAGAGDRELAIELMTAEVAANLPVEGDQAGCLATLLVDAIGPDVLLVDGELIDLDTLPTEFDAAAEGAIIASVAECGVDLSQF